MVIGRTGHPGPAWARGLCLGAALLLPPAAPLAAAPAPPPAPGGAVHLHAPYADGACEACHQAPFDGPVRLQAAGEALCTTCHVDLPAAAPPGGSFHAALRGRRGRAGCLSCHEPHKSGAARLLRQGGAALCGECHRDILEQARAGTGHPPAAEDCLACHRPHVSSAPHLLKAAPGDLCRGCHDPAGVALKRAHLQADGRSLDCARCHTPHGSGRKHLLAPHVHPPLLDGCDTCHQGRFDRLAENGAPGLCLLCHDAIRGAAAGAGVPHPAMELASCTDCHEPHASEQERLVRLPGGGECLACHQDQAPAAGETAHGVIRLIGCRACHEPHGGRRPQLLRDDGPGLCLACHDPSRPELAAAEGTVQLLGRFAVPAAEARAMATLRMSSDGRRDHPVPNHRALGTPTESELKRNRTTFKGALTCLTCHNPHKGRTGSLLRWNAASTMESCAHCHAK